MAHRFSIEPCKTYATIENAISAVNKKFPDIPCRYFIHTTDDGRRFFPVFVGVKCLDYGVHFHFNIIA